MEKTEREWVVGSAAEIEEKRDLLMNVSFHRISQLVTKEYFSFQAWDDRYSKGVWAALGVRENQIDTVRDLSSAGDLDMIPAMEYVYSADWLPYVTGKTMMEAMENLEGRLASLPQDQLRLGSPWANLVSQAIDALYDATNGRSWYDENRTSKSLDDLPATFALAIASNFGGGE